LHALEHYGSGRLGRADVMAPAIRLAEEGFAIEPYTAQTIAFATRRLRAFSETMRTFFLEDGVPLAPATSTREADRLVQPDLARTLRALAAAGPAALYAGDVGERMVADLRTHGGCITLDDLAAYRVRESPPLRTDYRGYRLLGLSSTSGSMTAFEALNVLSNFELASLGGDSAAGLHVVAEALRRAFTDRFTYLADTEYASVPVEGLLSPEYARGLADTITLERADPRVMAGDPWRFQPAGAHGARSSGLSAVGGDGCTTHLNVVDGERNMVSCTSTLGELFGSGVVVADTGITLNNGMTWFDPEPGHVNSIAAGKRTLWAPTPTLVLQDGRPRMAVGAPGGRRIISAVVQGLVNMLDFRLGVQAAVSRPRIHCEGRLTEVDGRFDARVVETLREMGHDVKLQHEHESSFRFARPSGIRLDPTTNRLHAGVHQFTPAWAFGY
jgi:gamma-glutamyltranspeptidase/glutathione hydrolase